LSVIARARSPIGFIIAHAAAAARYGRGGESIKLPPICRHRHSSIHRRITMSTFPRIERLPPYVFNITGELKMAARRRGEDIIDMSMGNPDGATPRHIVDKLIEAVNRPNTHGYSVSKGIPRLRKAISDWYGRRYDVQIDPDSEAIVTIGSKEGL